MGERAGKRPAAIGLQTEYAFTLPRGYVDEGGTLHREGVMRLAKAIDELAAQRDMRVRANPAYLTIVILARVVTRLGSLPEVNTGVVENLFATDLAFLEDLYQRINQPGALSVKTTCPNCQHEFDVDVVPAGES